MEEKVYTKSIGHAAATAWAIWIFHTESNYHRYKYHNKYVLYTSIHIVNIIILSLTVAFDVLSEELLMQLHYNEEYLIVIHK